MDGFRLWATCGISSAPLIDTGAFMAGFPRTQRAIAGVLEDAIRKAGKTPTSLARDLGRSQHFIRLMVRLGRDVTVAEWMAIAKELGVRPSTLLARVERRLKG